MEPRQPLRRNRDFRALWVGQAVSNVGISISSLAYPLVVLEATGSPAQAGLVGSVLAGTAFVLRLPAGALADRWDRRRLLLACDAGRALNAAGFAAVLATGHFFLAHVLAVAFVEAALGVLFGPAEAAAVRRVVAPEQRREAVAQNQSRAAIPGLVGPPLGGALLGAGRALPFVADAISYLVSLACVVSVRAPLGGGGRGDRDRPALAGVLDGLRWIWPRRFLRALLLWSVGVGVVFGAVGLLTLVVARERGASPAELGAMMALTSAGGVAGALAAPRLLRAFRPYPLLVAFAWVGVAAAFSLTVLHGPYGIGLAGAAAFLLAPAVGSIPLATVAAEAPDELQGRATSAAVQLATLGAPAGPVVAGAALSALGSTGAIVAYGCVLAAFAAVVSVAPAFRADAGPRHGPGYGSSPSR